jgi:hypothetical protein
VAALIHNAVSIDESAATYCGSAATLALVTIQQTIKVKIRMMALLFATSSTESQIEQN